MQKRYFFVLGIVLLFIGIFVVILISQQTPKARQKVITVSPNGQSTAPTAVVPTISLPPLGSTAKAATLQFYTYVTSSQNPLANGAYKASPYLAPEFKTVVGASNGNAPVFCPQNVKRNVIVGQESSYYYNNGYLTSEVISDATTSKSLFRITLENMNGKWVIFDVNCLP